jgi:hypothetical protein
MKCLFHTAGDGPHLRVGGIGRQASTIYKILNMNFLSIKKHEQEITLHFFIFKDGTLTFFIVEA